VLWFCVFAVLVPSPLLEFRYFIIPFMMLHLHDVESTPLQISLSIFINVLINVVTLWIFVFKTFTAPDGSLGRFMW
jgi:alpha-1,2-glucosyltransferase